MSTQFTKEFFAWLQASELSKEEVAKELQNTPSTLSKWKSIGIPKGKIFACQAIMQRHQTEELRPALLMRPTYEQFTKWNEAAVIEGKTIEKWATDGLDSMAAAETKLDLAAEDTPAYGSNIIHPLREEEENSGDGSAANTTA